MKILLLPNSFKGSISARETARIFSCHLNKHHQITSFPLSDGGDGFLDFFKALDNTAKKIYCTAHDAFLNRKRTSYLFLSDNQTAVIETAQICGLGGVKKENLDPLRASSFGVGEVILHAIKKGAKTIYIGLGGVACNDGGAGMAAACGVKFLNSKKEVVSLGTSPLLSLAQADIGPLKKLLKGVRFYAVADVTNPMLGKNGSAKIFGPQKGASAQEIKEIDKALTVYARVTRNITGKDIARTPSTAAAGAIAAGLYGYFNAKLLLGSDFLFQKAKLQTHFKKADLIITAEGKLDKQTFFGKAPLAVLKWAKKYKKPTLFVCGILEEKCLLKNPLAPEKVAVLSDFAPVEETQKNPKKFLKIIAKNI